jgi:hypothetical protein
MGACGLVRVHNTEWLVEAASPESVSVILSVTVNVPVDV